MSKAEGAMTGARRRQWARGLVPCALLLALAGCAPRLLQLPVDPGTPLPDYEEVHAQISAACAGVRTLSAELTLSGRAAGQRLSGRVHAGFERPASMRLEGVAPFGPPAFILVARGDADAVLLLPRDSRVVLGAGAEEILGALTGVTLGPADLQAVLAGCVSAAPQPARGQLHGNGWASIDLEDGTTLYLQRRRQAWELRAARRGPWQIEYPAWQARYPQIVRLRSDGEDVRVEMAVTLAQLEVNVGIPAAAFTVAVPEGAIPLSLDELREAGPLRGQ